jgi:hypothetical protein
MRQGSIQRRACGTGHRNVLKVGDGTARREQVEKTGDQRGAAIPADEIAVDDEGEMCGRRCRRGHIGYLANLA